ncbi:MAG: exodeoxyribonuclease VII large subunit [Patescibacteria group bacterium]
MEFPVENKIFSVSEFIALLNIGLKKSVVKILGEVGQVQFGPTGHVYFTLKDENNQGLINCIIWKSKYLLYGIKLQEGMKIMASGHPEVYAPNGRLSFISDTIELAGEGTLKKQYDELKKKLTTEGLFAPEKKRPLPEYPQKIGVITSKQGAVLADFLNNIGKFGFKIQMIDSRVEGQEAVSDLLASVKTFRKKDIDVLVIIRGGGSLESLMPFNNELLVREVATFPVPVIAGIGHDKDTPLVAMAADFSESTPTACANLLNESWEKLLLFLERCERNVIVRYEAILVKYLAIENKLKVAFEGFKNALSNTKNSLKGYLDSSLAGFKSLLSTIDQNLAAVEKAVFLNNPERQLRLGYSIASINGKIIRETKDADVGDIIDLKVSDGKITSEVKNIHPVK